MKTAAHRATAVLLCSLFVCLSLRGVGAQELFLSMQGSGGGTATGVLQYNDQWSHAYEVRELWVPDGTEAGTRMLVDVSPGAKNSSLDHFTRFGGDQLCFVAAGSGRKSGLYLSHGTSGGTFSIARDTPRSSANSLNAVVAGLFYLVTAYRHSDDRSENRVTVETLSRTQLWRGDASPSETVELVAGEGRDVDSHEFVDSFEPHDVPFTSRRPSWVNPVCRVAPQAHVQAILAGIGP